MTTILNHFRFPSFLLHCEWIVIRKTCLTKELLAHIYLDIVLLPFVSFGEIGSISMFVLVLTLTRKMVLQWGQRIAVMPSLVI
jgi:hypothetical protein